MSDRLRAPVVLLVYKRPDLTRRALDAVLRARPGRILVVADGPRAPDEAQACAATRAVIDEVPAEVAVERDFAEHNLGLRRRVTTGLDWAFSRTEEAIVVEDDCVAHPDFFALCDALLSRYRGDARVGQITGANPFSDRMRPGTRAWGYWFSAIGLPWGWATWRDRWLDHDVDMQHWPAFLASGWLRDRFGAVTGSQWERMLHYASEIDSWWIRWVLSQWVGGRASIVPRDNLVTNVGVDARAVHTRVGTRYERFGDIPAIGMQTPLLHPPFPLHDPEAERAILEGILPFSPLRRRLEKAVVRSAAIAAWRRR